MKIIQKKIKKQNLSDLNTAESNNRQREINDENLVASLEHSSAKK